MTRERRKTNRSKEKITVLISLIEKMEKRKNRNGRRKIKTEKKNNAEDDRIGKGDRRKK